MKSGLTITEMAQEIDRQSTAKTDYLVKPTDMEMESMGGPPMLRVLDKHGVDQLEPLSIQDTAHRQISSHLSIPWRYYERMLQEDPSLLSYNVNRWLRRGDSTPRMVRTIDGKARAFLSNRYRRIDNLDIARVSLPIIAEMQDARFESCQLTENYMYIKVVNTRLTAEVRVGDVVQAGVVISNSETGLGAVNIQPLVYRLVCSNGMVVNDAKLRRNHVGRTNSTDENIMLYSQETLEADDNVFVKKIQDTIRATVDEARFAQVLEKMRKSTEVKLNTADIPSVVKLASASFGITEAESKGVFQHLIEDADYTLYGLANAITRFSQDVDDYDRASKLEEVGYSVMTMNPAMVKQINNVTSIAERNHFMLPTTMGSDFDPNDVAEDLEGLDLSFPRVKIPGGGVPQFEMPGEDPEHPVYVNELEGIILYNHSANAYWPEGSEYDDNTPPTCQSLDGKKGYGNPGLLCATCGYNQFGSSSKGKGKLCKNMRTLYILRNNEFMPVQLVLPPTSLSPYKRFAAMAFALRNRPTYGSVVNISLKRVSSNGFDYSVAVFRTVRDITGEELESVKAFAEGFRKQLKATTEQRALELASENAIEHTDVEDLDLPDNDDHFAVGGLVDGERKALPA